MSDTMARVDLPAERLERRIPDLKPPLSEASALAEANRCLYCYDAPCIQACPTAINIPEFIRRIANGNVKDFKLDPPQDDDPERVPLTEAHQQGVFDPMAGTLMRVAGSGEALSPEVCQRTLPIFDGRMRYDLQLAFKRMDQVKADKGYAGPVVVCAVYFMPIAGYLPARAAIRYLSRQRDIEVWLAPIAGTRVLVPFRAEGPTPIGKIVMKADQFVSMAVPTRAANGAKSP